MPNYLKINFIVVFLLLMVFAGGEQLMAQNFGNTKSVKVDELSDDQIRMMMQRAKSMAILIKISFNMPNQRDYQLLKLVNLQEELVRFG